MMRKERGQDRPQKRTVGGRTNNRFGKSERPERGGQRRRISENERTERRGGQGRFSKSERSERSERGDYNESRPGRDNRRSDNPTHKRNNRFSEKNNDRGDRRQGRPQGRGVSKPESDRYLNKDGKVIRGRFGEKNLRDAQNKRTSRIQRIKKEDDGTMRLNRFIANAGICSRREADTYIASGVVTVNGKPVTEMGVRVKPGDDVRFNGQRISAESKVYVLLNKPKGFVTTLDDPHADKTVMDLVSSACPERIYPVGRLDKSTTGLLLFTNDGEMTKRLTHPKYNRKKIYHVHLDKGVSKNDLQQIVDGITLEDGFVAADSVSYVDQEDKKQVGIEIHSGKNRVVRRIFTHLGYKVQKLDRVYFCGLTKKNLPRGKWRFLTQDEVNFLKMGSF